MQILLYIVVLLASYLLGSIPFGLIIVGIIAKKDIRKIESGRTGGTNAMRAAGFWAGCFTAIADFTKSVLAVWLARWVDPSANWLHVFAPLAAVIGHNYSIFLVEKLESGRIKLRGGAGGAPTAGGAFGFWPGSLFVIVPFALLILFGIGYASLTTMSIPLIIIIIFSVRAWLGLSPWEYIFYGVFTEIILIWALRPNIRRLLNGSERLVGWRARRRNRKLSSNERKPISNQSSSSSSSSS